MRNFNTMHNATIQDSGHITFTLNSASEKLKLVKSLTKASAERLAPIQHKLHNYVPADPRVSVLNEEYIDIVSNWSRNMRRLGLAVHGLWQVGFDCEEGWYSWQYPERRIRYFIEYGEAFTTRRLIRSRNQFSAERR